MHLATSVLEGFVVALTDSRSLLVKPTSANCATGPKSLQPSCGESSETADSPTH